VLGLELFGKVKCVVDESETGRFATAKDGLKAEAEHDVWLCFVHTR